MDQVPSGSRCQTSVYDQVRQEESKEDQYQYCEHDPDRDSDLYKLLIPLLAHAALELQSREHCVDREDPACQYQKERR